MKFQPKKRSSWQSIDPSGVSEWVNEWVNESLHQLVNQLVYKFMLIWLLTLWLCLVISRPIFTMPN